MGLPYYKRFPRDFLEACVGMPFELRAGYGMILDLIYLKDGRLPLDKPWIAGHLGCSVRMVTKIVDGLVAAGKLTVSDGVISNKRADKIVEETRKYRDNQAENASGPRKNNDLREPEISQSDIDTEEDLFRGSKEEPRPENVNTAEADPNKVAWDLGVNILTSRARMKEGQARGFIGKLLRDHKITANDLLPSISSAMSNGTQDPVAYLTKAAKAVGERRNPAVDPPGTKRLPNGHLFNPQAPW